MSYSFEFKGQRKAVIAKVQQQIYLPDSLKKTIVEIIGTRDTSGTNAVEVAASGHSDPDGQGQIYKLEVKPIFLTLDPIPEPVAPAVESEKVPDAPVAEAAHTG